MRVSIFLICLALALPTSVSAATCEESAPDWPELGNSLEEIDLGLQMTEEPLSAIGDYFASENERLQSEKHEQQIENERLQQERSNLQQREQGLNEREQGLIVRENGIDGMQTNLDQANKKLRHGWIWLLAAGLIGGAIGWAVK